LTPLPTTQHSNKLTSFSDISLVRTPPTALPLSACFLRKGWLSLIKLYVGSGRVQVAKLLLDMLPTDLSAITNPEDMATEYLQYRQFFKIWEMLDRVVECQSLEVTQVMSKDTKKAWLNDYEVCAAAFFLL
jgi:hypothetical protein